MAAVLILEDLHFEPDRLPDGQLKGSLLNKSDTPSPPTTLNLTFLDETDRVTTRTSIPIPEIEPGAHSPFSVRLRLRDGAFFRYEASITKTSGATGNGA